MSAEAPQLSGPDLAIGVPIADLQEGQPLLGHAHGQAVMLVRRGDTIYATGATCTHYSGPLAEGLVVGDTVRCPWHHACFHLRTGEAIGAPALNPIATYQVERDGNRVRVGGERTQPAPRKPAASPRSIVVLGSGAAGAAATEMLRREGYSGPLTLIGSEPPVDRPNLSKDYLAGNAPEEWIPLRDAEFYRSIEVDLVTGDAARSIDLGGRSLTLESGRYVAFESLLYATGAEPIRLPIPGADRPEVHLLRTLDDSRAIIARAAQAKRAVVIGASFIGLEVAASLRARGVEVDVVAPEPVPLARVVGDEVGAFVRCSARGARRAVPSRTQADRDRRRHRDDRRRDHAAVRLRGHGRRGAAASHARGSGGVEDRPRRRGRSST